jgi:hypothetical protein
VRIAPVASMCSAKPVANESLASTLPWVLLRCDAVAERKVAGRFGITHRTWTKPGAMRIPSECHVLIVSESEVGQRPVAAEGTVVVEYDVPRESRGSRIRI